MLAGSMEIPLGALHPPRDPSAHGYPKPETRGALQLQRQSLETETPNSQFCSRTNPSTSLGRGSPSLKLGHRGAALGTSKAVSNDREESYLFCSPPQPHGGRCSSSP